MKIAEWPTNEIQRLTCLKKYDVLDTPHEGIFDNLVNLAAQICGVPIAAISLVDQDRQWFKSSKGLNVSQTPRDISFCGHTILGKTPLIVNDTFNDARFSDNPLVTSSPNIRFYAGVPLIGAGNLAIGSLCVIDTSPKILSDDQLNSLKTLADAVMSHLNLRLSNLIYKENAQDLLLSSMMVSHSSEAMMVMDADNKIVKINSACSLMTGYQLAELSGVNPASLIKTHQNINPFAPEMLNEDGLWSGEIWIKHKNQNTYLQRLTINTIFSGGPTAYLRVAFFVDITDITRTQDKLHESQLLLQNTEDLLKMASTMGQLGGWMYEVKTHSLTWSDAIAKIREIEPGLYRTIEDGINDYTTPWREQITHAFKNCLEKGIPYDEEMQLLTGKGRQIWVRTIAHPIFDNHGQVSHVHGLLQDINKVKQLEVLKIEKNEILKRIANDDDLSEILNNALTMLSSQHPQYAMSILKLNQKTQTLHHGAALNLPDDYLKAIDGVKIGPNIGSCGTTAFNKETTVVSDIANDIRWADFKDLAFSHSLAACWSVPIFSSAKEVLGTFAVYANQVYLPLTEELELLETTANIVGMAIEQDQSRQHLKLLEACIARLNDVILISEAEPTDAPGPMVTYVNQAFENMTGYTAAEIIGKSPRFLQGPESQSDALKKIKSALAKWEPVKTELINYKKNGDKFWVELDIVPVSIKNKTFTHWVAIQRDITQRKFTENQIQELAFFDQLTTLPNRQLLTNRLEQALANSKRTSEISALLFIDLDGFKDLNDLRGHDLGDFLLKEVACRLVGCVRDTDTVARFGGDEFVIILQNLSPSQDEGITLAKQIAQKVLSSFQEPFALNRHTWSCTASIGITLINDASVSTDEVLKQADIAMYDAKAGGKNGFRFFDPAMQLLVNKMAVMEEHMKSALSNNQFYLCYQPQVNSLNQLIGAEALIRWQHPTLGNIPPVEFINIAEDNGQILKIGQWVLDTACEQLSNWSSDQQKSKIKIAVNISPKQFRQPDFVTSVFNVIKKYNIDASRLELELTEGLLVDNVEDAIVKMTALKATGITFSVDDFGTGYSSLSYLKSFPLNQLKIDRSFVSDILIDTNSEVITRTIIALGQSLGLNVIAEGVEAQKQRDFLEINGCHLYQGYLYSKPLTIDLFETFISKRDIAS